MTPRHSNPKQTSRLTNARIDAVQIDPVQIEAALASPDDHILPSSGFAESVMAAVREEATAPAPLTFPWKRAIPGFIAGAGALAFLVAMLAAIVRILVSASTTRASVHAADDTAWLATMGHHAISSNDIWIAASFAIPLLCLLLMRKLLFTR